MKTSELSNIEFGWKFRADHMGYYMVAVKHVDDKRIVAYKPIDCTPIEWVDNNISQAPRGWGRVEAVVAGDIVYDIQKRLDASTDASFIDKPQEEESKIRKTDMMKMFTNEVASYIAEGWMIAPNNTSYSNCLMSIKLERKGERNTLRIMTKSEIYYDVYTFEVINELTGDTLEQKSYYYLWEWRRKDEDNHLLVTKAEVEKIVEIRRKRAMNQYTKTTRQFKPTRKLNIAGYKTTQPEDVTITRLKNGYNVHKNGGRRDLLVKF